jgi:hypothetical protein
MTLLKWPNRPKSEPLGAGRRPSVADRPLLAGHDTEMLAVKLTLGVLKIIGGCERAARGSTLPITRKTEAVWAILSTIKLPE